MWLTFDPKGTVSCLRSLEPINPRSLWVTLLGVRQNRYDPHLFGAESRLLFPISHDPKLNTKVVLAMWFLSRTCENRSALWKTVWELVKSQLLYVEYGPLEIRSRSPSLDWKQWELGATHLWPLSYLGQPSRSVHLHKYLSHDCNFRPIPIQLGFELCNWWITVTSRSLITIFWIFTYPVS